MIWILGLVVLGAVAGKLVLPSRAEPDCATTSQVDTNSAAVVVCQREYRATKQPPTGAILADAYRRSGNTEAAVALANELLSTDARATALQILGKIANAQERRDDAVRLLQEARQLHRKRGDHLGIARDDQFLGLIESTLKQYGEALQMLDEGITEAAAADDRMVEGYCHLTAARVLSDVGYFDAAHQEIDRAARQLSVDRDLAQLWYVRGNLEQEVVRGPLRRAHHEQAVASFERSLELATRTKLTSLALNLHLNLAYSLAELGRTEDAERHLAEAAALDSNREYESQRAQLAARIAYRRGDASLAFLSNDRQYRNIKDDDERIESSVMQTRIALAMHDLVAAARWAKLGVDDVEQVRLAQTASELRPWVLASRREPLELLFTALARAGRVEDAIGAFDRWQGRTLLDEMARPSPEPSPGLSSTATRIQSLGQWLPAVSKAPLMMSDGRAVTQMLRRIDLIALAVADGEVWRLTATRGRFRLDSLGAIEQLRDRLDRFISTSTDAALGTELGTLILPDDVIRTTDEPLYVVLDAPLAALPFVALRRNGRPLIAVRPVLRTPRLPVAGACRPPAALNSALVIADAAGDLPDARRESSRVATLFGTTPLVGAAATSTALFAAKSKAVLHIAVHADIDAGGGILKLHDRAVSAPEISLNKLGPQLVVLSACSTARSWDPELAGSLSTAFLAGGSQRVIATLRPVSDAGALELTNRFYTELMSRPGNADAVDGPVRALAKIQAELARTDNKEWPSFAVFGNDVCIPGAEGRAMGTAPGHVTTGSVHGTL